MTKELIEEARARAAHMRLVAKVQKNSPGAVVALEEADRMTRFADALAAERGHMQTLAKWVGVPEDTPSLEIACEASTALEPLTARQPTDDDREALKRIAEVASEQHLKESIGDWRKALGASMDAFPDDWELEFWHAGYKHGAMAMIEHQLSRAAVPDAATELRPLPENGCDKQAHDTMNRNINRVFRNNTGLMDALEVVKDERDAALAAVERVREIHKRVAFDDAPDEFHRKRCQITAGTWPCPTVAALDGAPDPEWEERLAACSKHGTHCWSCARHKERRRTAGPWLPVPGGEGEGS